MKDPLKKLEKKRNERAGLRGTVATKHGWIFLHIRRRKL